MILEKRQLLLLAFAGCSILMAVSRFHETHGASARGAPRPMAGWTPPVTLSGSRTSAFNPRAAVAASGPAVVVWTTANGIEYACCRNVDFRVQAAVSRGGSAFQSARAVSAPVRFTYGSATNTRADDLFHADATVDALGQPVVVWRRYNRRGGVRLEGATLRLDGRPRFVEPLSSFGDVEGGGAELAADSAGNAFAVWESGSSEGPRVEAATRPPGEHFRDRAVIGPETGNGSENPEVASAGDGTALAVWADASQLDDPAQVYGALRKSGGTFEPARPISAIGAYVDPAPVVAVDPAGIATVVWGRDHEVGGAWLEFSRAHAGAFTPQERLSPSGQQVDSARVASMPDGTSLVVWEAYVRASKTEGVYARSIAPNGQLGPVETLTTVEALSTVYGLAPELAVDAVGKAFVIWRQPDHARSRCCFRATAAIRSAGGSFGRPTVLSRPGRNARHPYVAAARDGHAIAVWERFDGTHWRIEASSSHVTSPNVSVPAEDHS